MILKIKAFEKKEDNLRKKVISACRFKKQRIKLKETKKVNK